VRNWVSASLVITSSAHSWRNPTILEKQKTHRIPGGDSNAEGAEQSISAKPRSGFVRISRTCIDTSYTRGRSRAERYTIPTMHLIIEAENVFFGLLVSMWALDMSMYIRNGDLGVLF
jgi:hypothetical protein